MIDEIIRCIFSAKLSKSFRSKTMIIVVDLINLSSDLLDEDVQMFLIIT